MHLEQPTWQVDAAVLKLHSRRCCCLDFHPTKVHPWYPTANSGGACDDHLHL